MRGTASHHIARSAVWNHVGKVAEYALFYLSTIVIARRLGVESNGHLAGVLSIVQLLVVLSAAGVEVSLNKFLPQDGGANPGTRYLVARLLGLRLGLYAAVCAVAVFVLPLVLPSRSSDWAQFLGILIILGLLRSATPVLNMLLVARFRTGQAATVGVLARGAEFSALLIVGNAITIPVVLAIFVAGSAMQVAGCAVASKVEWAGESRRIPVMPVVTFGAVFWLNTIIDYFLGRQGDIMFLTLLRPESSSASLYDVAYSIVQVGLLVLTVGFSGVSLAALSQYAVGDRARMGTFYAVVVRITSLLTIPVLSFLIVIAPDLLNVVYSDKYAGAVDILRIILGFRILSRLFATGENADYLLALGRVWTVVQVGAVAACCTVAMHLVLIPRWGAIGAACAGGTGVLLANAMGGIAVKRTGGVVLQWRAWGRIMAVALGAGLASFLIPHFGTPILHIAIAGVVFLIAFVLLMVAVRPLQREDLDAVKAALGKLPEPLRMLAGSR
jgi:O-antigen/teichoic acid export membrane protein